MGSIRKRFRILYTCTSALLVPTARYLPDLFHWTEEMYVFSLPVLHRLLLPPLSVSSTYTTPPRAMASLPSLLQSNTFRSEKGLSVHSTAVNTTNQTFFHNSQKSSIMLGASKILSAALGYFLVVALIVVERDIEPV